MTDPVIDKDGNSYERAAIEEWIRQNGNSPITRNALSLTDLVPNRALRDAIDAYCSESITSHPFAPASPSAPPFPSAPLLNSEMPKKSPSAPSLSKS